MREILVNENEDGSHKAYCRRMGPSSGCKEK